MPHKGAAISGEESTQMTLPMDKPISHMLSCHTAGLHCATKARVWLILEKQALGEIWPKRMAARIVACQSREPLARAQCTRAKDFSHSWIERKVYILHIVNLPLRTALEYANIPRQELVRSGGPVCRATTGKKRVSCSPSALEQAVLQPSL